MDDDVVDEPAPDITLHSWQGSLCRWRRHSLGSLALLEPPPEDVAIVSLRRLICVFTHTLNACVKLVRSDGRFPPHTHRWPGGVPCAALLASSGAHREPSGLSPRRTRHPWLSLVTGPRSCTAMPLRTSLRVAPPTRAVKEIRPSI